MRCEVGNCEREATHYIAIKGVPHLFGVCSHHAEMAQGNPKMRVVSESAPLEEARESLRVWRSSPGVRS